jgi:hypothetical protein
MGDFRHTLPRDFGMHPVDMVWQILLGESDPPASGAALRRSVGHSPWRKGLIYRCNPGARREWSAIHGKRGVPARLMAVLMM